MKDLIIAGNSGLAHEFKWIIDRINEISPTWNFLGYIDINPAPDVVGDDDFLINYDKEVNVVIGIGSPQIRRNLYEKYKVNPNIIYPNIIDPSVQYSSSVEMGMGNVICAGSILTVDIVMGDFNIINLDCTVGHEAKLNDFIYVNPSVNISGNVTIGSNSNIGTGTNIIQGINIGPNVIVGAGTVVIRDIEGNHTVVGVPARIIK